MKYLQDHNLNKNAYLRVIVDDWKNYLKRILFYGGIIYTVEIQLILKRFFLKTRAFGLIESLS